MSDLDEVRRIQEERWMIQDLEKKMKEAGKRKPYRERNLLRALRGIRKYRQLLDPQQKEYDEKLKEITKKETELRLLRHELNHIKDEMESTTKTLHHYINLKYEYQ